MLRKIPQSDLEMENMLAKKERWTWVGHWTSHEPKQPETHVIPDDSILGFLWLPWLAFLLKNVIVQLIYKGVVLCCMDPLWHGGGVRHNSWWLHIGWRCLPTGQELVWWHCDQCAILLGWTLPHWWRCTHVGQQWHPAQRFSTEVKKTRILLQIQYCSVLLYWNDRLCTLTHCSTIQYCTDMLGRWAILYIL